jgi:RimJ/RimL family protein N-acetyltransferase
MTNALETRRLILRPLRDSDLIKLASTLNNRRVTINTGSIPWPYTLDDAYAFQRFTVDCRRSLRTVIAAKTGNGDVIGGVGYYADPSWPCAEIGYWLAEDAWGKGYGFEAAEAVTEHAFAAAGHDYLVADYTKGNEASRRILDRLGFRVTGHAFGHSRSAGCLQPVTWLELTAREWRNQKGREKRRSAFRGLEN